MLRKNVNPPDNSRRTCTTESEKTKKKWVTYQTVICQNHIHRISHVSIMRTYEKKCPVLELFRMINVTASEAYRFAYRLVELFRFSQFVSIWVSRSFPSSLIPANAIDVTYVSLTYFPLTILARTGTVRRFLFMKNHFKFRWQNCTPDVLTDARRFDSWLSHSLFFFLSFSFSLSLLASLHQTRPIEHRTVFRCKIEWR